MKKQPKGEKKFLLSDKRISASYSTGGGGGRFEIQVLSAFVTLMLSKGNPPLLNTGPIEKMVFQGRRKGYRTDDVILFTAANNSLKATRILCQIKSKIAFDNSKEFSEVITAAWRDFCDPDVFTPGTDAIMLITGPLSKNETSHVRSLFEMARGSNASDFLEDLNRSHYTHNEKRKKYGLIQRIIKSASDTDFDDEKFHDFLRHFYLIGFDLDVRGGVTLAILQSMIALFAGNPTSVWAEILTYTFDQNFQGSVITQDDLPDNLRQYFRKDDSRRIPADLISENVDQWIKVHGSSEIAQLALIGSWQDRNTEDMSLIEQFVDQDSKKWLEIIRRLKQTSESPLIFSNSIWRISERELFLVGCAPLIYEESIIEYAKFAVKVLSEVDPKFNLPKDRQQIAPFIGVKMKYSNALRQATAETLILLALNSAKFENLHFEKAKFIVIQAVRSILSFDSWEIYASLGRILLLLAEAAPAEVLSALSRLLKDNPNATEPLFAESTNSLFGTNYMLQILWSLEIMAWDEETMSESALILSKLSTLEKNDRSGNRPILSLIGIFLPWYPQTFASVEIRKGTFAAIKREFPDVAWQLVKKLLPKQIDQRTSSAKPSWTKELKSFDTMASSKDSFQDQSDYYTTEAITIAGGNVERLIELVGIASNFSISNLMILIENLDSEAFADYEQRNLAVLYRELGNLKRKIEKSKSASWEDIVLKIASIQRSIEPSDPIYVHMHLFDIDQYSARLKGESHDQYQTRIAGLKKNAMKEIYDFHGINGVFRLAMDIKRPDQIGTFLAHLENSTIDNELLPDYLTTKIPSELQIVKDYVFSRDWIQESVWSKAMDFTNWSITDKAKFLTYLPFRKSTWELVAVILGNKEDLYWREVRVNGYIDRTNQRIAQDKLQKYGRPAAALESVLASGILETDDADFPQIMSLLAAAADVEDETHSRPNGHQVVELIKRLQEIAVEKGLEKEMFLIEWQYIFLMDSDYGAYPKFQSQFLASEPEYFVQATKVAHKLYSKEAEPNSAAADHLLDRWKTIPGTDLDGKFSREKFLEWINKLNSLLTEPELTKLAHNRLGEVLIHSPSDSSGLWIDKSVAELLDQADSEDILNSYAIAQMNSRGVYINDGSGNEEQMLADKYSERSNQLLEAGFPRFAREMQKIAKGYERDAIEQRLQKRARN